MGKAILLLFLLKALATMSQCGPLIEERNFGLGYPVCNLSSPCLDPATFCGSNVELISKWFVGNRCYPKKTSMGLCNQPVVCLSGVCNIFVFGLGICL